MTTIRPWDRMLWGVAHYSPRSTPILIGSLWSGRPPAYAGEATRCLLFTRRADARAWCAHENAKNRARPKGDVCRDWRYRVVRVRETVVPV